MDHSTMNCLSDTKAYLSWEEDGSWITRLDKTAEVQKNTLPKAAESILDCTCMDDIATGCDNDDITLLVSDLTKPVLEALRLKV